MTVLTEGRHPGEFIVSEAPRSRSRDNITIASGSGIVKAGTVLGLLRLGAATAAAVVGTGNPTISAVTVTSKAKTGVYRVEFTAATKFDVIDPDGFKLKSGSTGAAYADDIGFTITAGGTPAVAGDHFLITVETGAGTYVPAAHGATDGSDVPAAINIYEVDTTDAAMKVAAITRDAEVNGAELEFHSSVDDTNKKDAKKAALKDVGIICR